MKLGRAVAAYLPVNLATVLVAFGGLAILTRILGPAEYGRYALAMVTMAFVHMSLFTWIEAAVERFQARAEKEDDEATHLRTVYTYSAILGATGVALSCIIVWLLPLQEPLRNVLVAALMTTGLQLMLNLGFEAHKAAHRIGRYSAVQASHQTLSFLIGILIIMATPIREMGMFIGIGVSALIVGAIDIPFMLRRLRGGRVESARLKRYFAYGAPVGVSLVLAYALNSGDMYLITLFMGEAQAGTYSAGYNLANRGIDVIFVWFSMAMTPVAVTAFEHDGVGRSVEIMRSYGAMLLWITMPAAVGLALVAEPLGFVLGENVRAGAVRIIPWIAIAGVLNGLTSYYAQRAYMLSGRTGSFAKLLIAPVLLNIGLNIVLIPRFGLTGAVAATIASYAVGLFVVCLAVRKHYPLPIPVTAFAQVGLACTIMAGAVIALPAQVGELPDVLELLVKATVGAGVYLFVCFATDTAGCRATVRDVLDRVRPTALEAAE